MRSLYEDPLHHEEIEHVEPASGVSLLFEKFKLGEQDYPHQCAFARPYVTTASSENFLNEDVQASKSHENITLPKLHSKGHSIQCLEHTTSQ